MNKISLIIVILLFSTILISQNEEVEKMSFLPVSHQCTNGQKGINKKDTLKFIDSKFAALPKVKALKQLGSNCVNCSKLPEINYLNTEPLVVFTNDPFVIVINTTSSQYDSIKISGFSTSRNESKAIINNSPVSEVTLLDNGEGRDIQKGDGIYTSPNILWNWTVLNRRKTTSSELVINYGDLQFFEAEEVASIKEMNIGLGIRRIEPTIVNPSEIFTIDSTIQYTSHLINIVSNQKFSDRFDLKITDEKLKIFGKVFCDDNQELIFGYGYPTPRGNIAGSHITFNNEVTGVCLGQLKSNEVSFAEGITFMSWGNMDASLFVHEYLHRYAAFCRNTGFASNSNHWNPIEFAESGFFSNFTDFKELPSGLISVKEVSGQRVYNELELYYLGILSIDDIPWPIKFIKDANAQGVDTEANEFRILYSGEITLMDKETFINKHDGLRTPIAEPNVLNSSLVVFSNKLLTPTELSYYQYKMESFEKKSETKENNNLFFASKGRLAHQTKLRKIEVIDTLISLPSDTTLTLPNGQLITYIDDGKKGFYFSDSSNVESCLPKYNYTIQVNFVDKDKDGFTSEVDCDDENPSINTEAMEIANNGVDEDCDGEDLITSSIYEINGGKLSIYPNPVQENLVIDFNNTGNLSCEFIDITGKVLKTTIIQSGINTINMNGFRNGIYFLRISAPMNNQYIVSKLIKE